MERRITFDSVMKEPDNWPADLNLENMEKNYKKVKRIMDKFFFEEYPKHPEAFVVLFSKPDFVDELLSAMVRSGITNLNNVWFRECTEEEKKKLIQKGLISPFVDFMGISTVALMGNGNDFFVNLLI